MADITPALNGSQAVQKWGLRTPSLISSRWTSKALCVVPQCSRAHLRALDHVKQGPLPGILRVLTGRCGATQDLFRHWNESVYVQCLTIFPSVLLKLPQLVLRAGYEKRVQTEIGHLVPPGAFMLPLLRSGSPGRRFWDCGPAVYVRSGFFGYLGPAAPRRPPPDILCAGRPGRAAPSSPLRPEGQLAASMVIRFALHSPSVMPLLPAGRDRAAGRLSRRSRAICYEMLVPRDRIELPTPASSVRCSTV